MPFVTAPRPSPTTGVFDPTERPLTQHEARVLGVLMEKARTVPDSYPLSLNTLAIGCNQKTSRDPVLEMNDEEVLAAIESLKLQSLVFEGSGSRVTRYEHNAQRVIGVGEQQAVLLGLLMLRGPQTAAELRQNAERWYKFADTGSVEVFLYELSAPDTAAQTGRPPEKGAPLVLLLPRQPGAREQRWAHLLCGNSIAPSFGANFSGISAFEATEAAQAAANLIAKSERLEALYGALEERLVSIEARLGALEASAMGAAAA